MKTSSLQRRYDLDWLRIMAIGVVFIYHSSRFFNLSDWHLKSQNLYFWVEIFTEFITRWMMPLFFVISGISLYYVIGKTQKWTSFFTDKFLRLMIPVLFASVTHAAIHVYVERASHGRFEGSFFQFIPHYFRGVYSGIGLSGSGSFAFHGMHLWYLLFLFVYGLLCYKLFSWFKNGGKNLLQRLTDSAAKPGLNYLIFIAPLVLLKAAVPASILEVGNGGWGFLYYLWFLIAGFILISSADLQNSIQKQRWVSLILAIGFTAAYLHGIFGIEAPVLTGATGNWTIALLNFFCSWSWLFAILGFGMKHLSVNRPILKTLNEGVLAFFILHQTVLLGLGYFIISWSIPGILQWLLISISSFVFIICVYTLMIRKVALFRFLFGMKTNKNEYGLLRRLPVQVLLLVVWLLVTIGAGMNTTGIKYQKQYPMISSFNSVTDIVLTASSIGQFTQEGIQIIQDLEASNGKAIELVSGNQSSIAANPSAYLDFEFNAQAGRYFVWIRGKSDTDSELTDSIWIQIDSQIGTSLGSVHLGNWNSFHPVGEYTWASDVFIPYEIVLTYSGNHILRIQPRQTPHRIDQIWLSRNQYRIPESNEPLPITPF